MTNFKPGSGDIEDDPNVMEDQYGTFYGVHIGSLADRNSSFGASYNTLEEAKENAAMICPHLDWTSC